MLPQQQFIFSSILSTKAVYFCFTLRRLFFLPSPETDKFCFYFSPRSNTCTWKRELAAPSWLVFPFIGEKHTGKQICACPHSTANHSSHGNKPLRGMVFSLLFFSSLSHEDPAEVHAKMLLSECKPSGAPFMPR